MLPALGRAAALQECPCGAFGARCAHLLRKWASVKARPFMQGLCPCTPPGTVTVPGPLQLCKR